MIRILFVCHGNICRSVMAECIMQKIVDDEKRSADYVLDSCATSYEEIGNPIYPKAKRKLLEKGVKVKIHRARHIEKDDYDKWDLFIAMDNANLRDLKRMFLDPENKIRMLNDKAVADPWYTDDFETAFDEIYRGCKRLFKEIEDAG